MAKSVGKHLGAVRDPLSCRTILGLIAVAAAATAVLANTLTNSLVYDDHFQIIENPWIRDIRNVPTILTTGVRESGFDALIEKGRCAN